MRSVPASDSALVARLRAGDDRAFREIYLRHEPGVRAIVRARLGAQGDPVDAVQDVFATAWIRLGGLRDPACLRPWLAQIARRTAIDHGRRAARAPVGPGEPALLAVPDPRPGPEEEVTARDLADRLGRALRDLSPRDATAMALAAAGPAAVAAALGVSEGNAKVIVHRARRRLRTAAA